MKYSGAVAVVEVAGLPTAIACADAMVKSANVTLIGYEITKGGPGMVNVKICGDVGAVQAAVDAGCAVANQITQVVSKVIMPRPHADLGKMLLNRNAEAHFSRQFDTDAKEAKAQEEARIREEAKAAEEAKAQEEARIREEARAAEAAKAQEEARIQEKAKAAVEAKAKEEAMAKQETKPKEEPKPNTPPAINKKNPKDNHGKK